MRSFLAESATLCVIGGLIGYLVVVLVVARYSTLSMTVPIYGTFSFSLHLKLDTTVVVFSSLLLLLGILVAGFPPAVYASSPRIAVCWSWTKHTRRSPGRMRFHSSRVMRISW